uniref:Cytochrome c oxidase subunit 2 n=1 Tax=Wiebesia pumilae TaxID=150944 RepID=A0A8A3US89_9HYME|nr:cytochrome c oxidase subunit II [Wiebesia pumilae]
MPVWGQMMLQDSNSPLMQNMIFYHDYLMVFVFMVMMMFIYMLIVMFINNKSNDLSMIHGDMLEIVWTLIPMGMLLILTFPSLHLLYLTDMAYALEPDITVKILGHQWYWSYQYGDFNKSFDSYMVSESNHKEIFRLLDVDNHLVLPINLSVRMIVGSVDVIHSFTVPSLGFKVDAVPGRINLISTMIQRPGVYYGQCSEICGINHSYMPIALEATSVEWFLKWLDK